MIKETKALRESLHMARAKAEKLELDNRELENIAEVRKSTIGHSNNC